MDLKLYIDLFFDGKKAGFARAVGVLPQQVTIWINRKFIVVDHVLYSPRRRLQNDAKPIAIVK